MLQVTCGLSAPVYCRGDVTQALCLNVARARRREGIWSGGTSTYTHPLGSSRQHLHHESHRALARASSTCARSHLHKSEHKQATRSPYALDSGLSEDKRGCISCYPREAPAPIRVLGSPPRATRRTYEPASRSKRVTTKNLVRCEYNRGSLSLTRSLFSLKTDGRECSMLRFLASLRIRNSSSYLLLFHMERDAQRFFLRRHISPLACSKRPHARLKLLDGMEAPRCWPATHPTSAAGPKTGRSPRRHVRHARFAVTNSGPKVI